MNAVYIVCSEMGWRRIVERMTERRSVWVWAQVVCLERGRWGVRRKWRSVILKFRPPTVGITTVSWISIDKIVLNKIIAIWWVLRVMREWIVFVARSSATSWMLTRLVNIWAAKLIQISWMISSRWWANHADWLLSSRVRRQMWASE